MHLVQIPVSVVQLGILVQPVDIRKVLIVERDRLTDQCGVFVLESGLDVIEERRLLEQRFL